MVRVESIGLFHLKIYSKFIQSWSIMHPPSYTSVVLELNKIYESGYKPSHFSVAYGGWREKEEERRQEIALFLNFIQKKIN